MEQKRNKINRRNFLKTVGALGVGSAIASVKTNAEVNEPNTVQKTEEAKLSELPRRKLGKSGIEIPVLANGLMFDVMENQIILRANIQQNLTYWDTAYSYAGGNSELGIGKFLARNPEARKDLFIVSKASGARRVEDVENRLQTSLKRMNIDYIDAYYAPHGADDPSQFTDELRRWAEGAKKRKLIRFFGFSTHKNMAKCLAGAAKLDWIDMVMPSYNFRVMQDPEMRDAVEACHEAKIGVVAMKTTGKTTIRRFRMSIETEADKKMVRHFLEKGFTPEQAGLKFALQDERVACAPVQMENVAVLTANVAAVLDKTKLSQADMAVLREYARQTCHGYCPGCAHICDAALPEVPYVSDIMRYLMYYNSYGDKQRARELFAQIPGDVRRKLLSADYGPAEAHCPQHLPIAKLVAEAVRKLA